MTDATRKEGGVCVTSEEAAHRGKPIVAGRRETCAEPGRECSTHGPVVKRKYHRISYVTTLDRQYDVARPFYPNPGSQQVGPRSTPAVRAASPTP